MDVGANIGSYTLIASELSSNVIAIEPHPQTYKTLLKNIQINNRANVTAINMAVGNEAALVYLTDVKENSLNKISLKGTIPVECVTLEKIFQEYQVKRAILKIDVEGGELAVLEGLDDFIDDCWLIFIENGARIEIMNYFIKKSFIGPLHFHVNKGLILDYSQPGLKEDEIFVNNAFLKSLDDIGIVKSTFAY